MKIVCSHSVARLPKRTKSVLPVLLYGRAEASKGASVGAAVADELRRAAFQPPQRAVDLLTLALSVAVADLALSRQKSPDGWTREIELNVEVAEADFWKAQAREIEELLRFLTTDIWKVSFRGKGYKLPAPKKASIPQENTVALLSGGADSLVGVLDLVADGARPMVVSQTVLGEGETQSLFAREIGGGLRHLQLNHNAKWPGDGDRDQRARSMIFLAYGVLAASTTRAHVDGLKVPLVVSENGMISVNPPLTDARLGSLTTRTTHPVYTARFQRLLKAADLRVELSNPYQSKTKGEMFRECKNQTYLVSKAHVSTSCSRFRTFGLKHCGRCVPCMIRRSAFHRWGVSDRTRYKYPKLGKAGADHRDFDDVRSVMMALEAVKEEGLDRLLGATLSSELITNRQPFLDVVARGFKELNAFLDSLGVR